VVDVTDPLWTELDLLGVRIPISGYLIPPLILFATFAALIWILSNRPKIGEFLIETEGELKKISWPPRKEWVNSSLAVMVVIALFVVYLYAVDTGLSALFIWLQIGF
jgi:preprotein translocase SecE subunit